MEANKITKKEFINILSNNKSIFLGSIFNRKEELSNLICDSVKNFSPTESNERRTVVKIQTNAICFSNGSSLYFDQRGEKTYHRIGNVIFQQIKNDYSKDNSCSYNDILYSAVIYYIEF